MKALIVILALILAGCASTSAEYTAPDGTTVKVETDTLLKTVKDAKLKWGEVEASLGSSSTEVDQRLIACLLAPELEGCS